MQKNKRYLYEISKRFFEIIFSLFIIIVLFPFFIFLAFLIKLSSKGPIFYRQIRLGKNKKPFKCIKFRTMSEESEDILKNLLNRNKELREEFEKTQKLKNDPRVTPIGKFLRKTSLDELPQFLNVIKTDMSLVGPRPALFSQTKLINLRKSKKIDLIRPGITGLAQINNDKIKKLRDKVSLDYNYLKNKSLFLDIQIIFLTFKKLFKF